MTKNIRNLLDFLRSENKSSNILIINTGEESLNYFYLYIILHYSKILNYKIIYNDESENNKVLEADLFIQKKIFIYLKAKIKNKTELMQSNEKKIFFIDYRTFKSLLPKYLSINTYDLKKDIEFFLVKEIGLNNEEIINSIFNNPEYTYSELSKINSNENHEELFVKKTDDKITNLRKLIYKNKNGTNLDLVNIYKLIKDEVNIKKFNFLTS